MKKKTGINYEMSRAEGNRKQRRHREGENDYCATREGKEGAVTGEGGYEGGENKRSLD